MYNLDVLCTNSFVFYGSTCMPVIYCLLSNALAWLLWNELIVCWYTGTPMWEPNPEAHTVTVQEPSKQKKFKGIKTFTAYQVVPSSTQRAVSRRYKHYDWLHSRLEEKFTLNSVPPLPDKQYYGKKLIECWGNIINTVCVWYMNREWLLWYIVLPMILWFVILNRC